MSDTLRAPASTPLADPNDFMRKRKQTQERAEEDP